MLLGIRVFELCILNIKASVAQELKKGTIMTLTRAVRRCRNMDMTIILQKTPKSIVIRLIC